MQTISELTVRHLRIVDLLLAGLSQKAIADELNISQQQVSVITNSPTFQHELAIRRSSLRDKVDERLANRTVDCVNDAERLLKESAKEAASRLVSLLTSENDSVALNSAANILDRVGLPKAQKIDTTNRSVVINLTAEQLETLKQTVSELKAL